MIVLRLGKPIAMALARHDLTENQYRALGFIDEGDPDLTEMGTRLVVKRPNLTTLIDGLVARGLVERHRRELDRRRVDLTLTAAGKALFVAATDEADAALAAMARLAGGDPGRRLDALSAWGDVVEEGAALLRTALSSQPTAHTSDRHP
jgi:DNA-binding MarR family transcriptional regulator